jgi:hypothetical protein
MTANRRVVRMYDIFAIEKLWDIMGDVDADTR